MKKTCNPNQNFYHGGATGDIIYSLVAVRAMGGGNLYTALPEPLFSSVKPLLEYQPYIGHVYACAKEAAPAHCIDLDVFRNAPNLNIPHLAQMHLDMLHVTPGWDWRNNGWLYINRPPQLSRCFINRTPRYNDPHCDWNTEISHLLNDGTQDYVFFMGYKSDYNHLLLTLHTDIQPRVLYYNTSNLLEAAMILDNATSFTGNQSALLAIMQGLGHPYRMERAPHHRNCNLDVARETVINKNIGDG